MPDDVRESLLNIRKILLVLAWIPDRYDIGPPKGLDGLANELSKLIVREQFVDFMTKRIELIAEQLDNHQLECSEVGAYPAQQELDMFRQLLLDGPMDDVPVEEIPEWLEDQAEKLIEIVEFDLQQAFGSGHTLSF